MKINICRFLTLFFLIAGIALNLSGCGTSGGMDDSEEGGGGTSTTVVEPAAIEMSTGKTSIFADGISSTTITAAMTGSSGEPVSQGTSVTFSTTLGKFPNGQTSYTVKTPDETGSVSTSIIAGTVAGTAQIRGLAGSVSQATTLEFTNTGTSPTPSASTITLTATPDKIPSDGVSFSKITAVLKDSTGTAVSAGTVLNFTTTYGTFLSGGQSATAVTDANGSGSVSLISSTADGVATVTCSSGGIAQVISVIFGQGATNLPVASISLSANPSTINPDGFSSTVVTATLSDSGGTAVPDGTQVQLATTLGKFPNGLQSIALTTSSGKAAVALISIADEEGVAKVTASAGGVSQSTSVFIGVTEETAPPSKITISAGAASLIPNGKTSTNIDVNVTDSKGTAVADGTQVTVAIIEGTGSFEKIRTETVITRGTVSGTLANLTYYAYSTPGTVVIQASTQNGLSASVQIALTEGLIVLSANPAELIANGSAESVITAQLRDADFNILQDAGIQITFSTDSGTFKTSGDRQVTGTTQGGVATVTYVASRQAGAVKISASATGYGSAETSLTLVSQQIASLTLSTPDAIPADGLSSTTLTATAKDSAGNAVSKGTPITFKINNTGYGKFPNGTGEFTVDTPDDSGSVTVSVISAGTTAGTATVTATAGSVTQSTTVDFTTPGSTLPILTLSGPAELVGDGKATGSITATLKLASGDAVPVGTAITLSTSLGEFSNGSKTYSEIGSSVTASLRSEKVTETKSATVTASALGVSRSINVLFTFTYVAGPPNKAKSSLTVNPAKLVAGAGTTSTIQANVNDADGNPAAANVIFKVVDSTGALISNGGTVAPASTSTTNGVATSVYTPPASAGDYYVMATIVGSDGTKFNLPDSPLKITVAGPEIAAMTVTSNRYSVPINKTGTANYAVIKAAPTLEGGAKAPDGTVVTFSIEGVDAITNTGTLEKTEAATFNGVAEVKLYSGTDAGKVKVIAQTGSIIAESAEIEYTRGSIELSVTKNAILGSGGVQVDVKAVVKDENGTPVVGGTVNFSVNDVTLGQVSPAQNTTVSGVTSTVFTATTKGGTATITGSWVDTNGSPMASGTVDIQILNPPAFILVAEGYPTPTSINVKGTGGQATSQIVFDVKDASGELVADGYRIDFEILTGPNGGEELSPVYAATSNGQVSTILRSGFKSGPVSIKATYHDDTNVSTSTSQITIVSGPPVGEEFGISAQYYNISGLEIINLQDPIQADVGDFSGNAVPENTAISFKTYNTGGEIHPASAGTSGIYATSTLYSVASPIPTQGFLSVTAEAVNGGRTTHITSLAVVPQTENTQILYAGTDGGGMYKSTNSGSTWQNISRSSTIQGQNWIHPYVNDVDVDPDNYNTVYAATGYLGKGNLYRSFDGGLNWNSNNTEEWNGVFSTDSVVGGTGSVLTVLCDDDGSDTGNGDRYVWIGTEGLGVFYATDGKHFTQSASMGHGKIVQDIVKVEGTNGASAKLYAGTDIGVFYSTDGGITWTEKGGFDGDYITKLALYPKKSSSGNDVLYAGTGGAGIWVSLDSAATWTRYAGGIGNGLSASSAKEYEKGKNKGTGIITDVTVKDANGEFYKGTPSDDWTVTVGVSGSGSSATYTYSIAGTESGDKTAELVANDGYYVIPNMLRFKPEGSFANEDKFIFSTTRDSGENIKDILVDKSNSMLYVLTYLDAEVETEAPHSVGNVYVHDLNIDGSLPLGDWREANTNLPQFDPPDDISLFGQHAIALDNPDNPKTLFIGGEGINFYKATSGLSTGTPAWQSSKNGLTNRVMARMPILFSDICSMDIEYPPTEIEGVVYTNTTTQATISAVVGVVYVVYIQDQNGNPPISGSTFTVTLNGTSVRTVTYPDALRYPGTFYDPSDPSTDNPYIIPISLDRTKENKIVFSFKPTCNTATVPGCSGANEEYTYTYPEVKKPTGTGW